MYMVYKDLVRTSPQYLLLDQCFSTDGTRATGGMQIVVWWYASYLGTINFHYSILRMLIALINCLTVCK
jgi:hypothetical protein